MAELMTREQMATRLREIASGQWSCWNMFAHDHLHGLERAAMVDAMEAVKLSAALQVAPNDWYFNIIFDGPPGPEPGRFVEVETDEGMSINAGVWHDRGDGTWSLRIAARGIDV